MRFGFLKRRKKQKEIRELSVEEAEKKIIEEIESNKKLIEDFINKNSKKLNDLINELIHELKNLDSSSLHPRLKGIAKNFKSSMLELWDGEIGYEKIRKNMEKVALFKLKHFRLLFGVNPQEISKINEILSEIAEIVSTVESKRSSVGFDGLNEVLIEIKRLKEILKNKEKLIGNKRKSEERVKNYKNMVKEAEEIKTKLSEIESDIEILKSKIAKREDYVRKLIATVRKPMKSFAHKTGSKINFDDTNELEFISKKVMTEIVRGDIKVKSAQASSILSALKEIGKGRLREEIEEINILKEMLTKKKAELQKLKSKMPKFDVKSIEREIESIDKKIDRLCKEYNKIKVSLENKLSKIFGGNVILV